MKYKLLQVGLVSIAAQHLTLWHVISASHFRVPVQILAIPLLIQPIIDQVSEHLLTLQETRRVSDTMSCVTNLDEAIETLLGVSQQSKDLTLFLQLFLSLPLSLLLSFQINFLK